MLARDSLASVDGFRIIVALTMELLFGLRCCPFDPDCNNGEHACPCQDIFGSSSSPEGGLKYKLSLGLDDTHKHIKPTASLRNSSAKHTTRNLSPPLPTFRRHSWATRGSFLRNLGFAPSCTVSEGSGLLTPTRNFSVAGKASKFNSCLLKPTRKLSGKEKVPRFNSLPAYNFSTRSADSPSRRSFSRNFWSNGCSLRSDRSAEEGRCARARQTLRAVPPSA